MLRHAHKGTKERNGDSRSAPRVQTGELLTIESATSAKASKRGLNLPPANPRPKPRTLSPTSIP